MGLGLVSCLEAINGIALPSSHSTRSHQGFVSGSQAKPRTLEVDLKHMSSVSSTVRKHAKGEQITHVEKSTHKLYGELIMNVIYENGQTSDSRRAPQLSFLEYVPF